MLRSVRMHHISEYRNRCEIPKPHITTFCWCCPYLSVPASLSCCLTFLETLALLLSVAAWYLSGQCTTVKVDLLSEGRHVCAYTPGCNSLSTRPSNLGTGCGWLVSFIPLPLLSRGKSPQYPLYNNRQGGPNGRSGRYGEKKSILSVPGIELRFLGSSTPWPRHCTDWAAILPHRCVYIVYRRRIVMSR
jgi:hypothetical protein